MQVENLVALKEIAAADLDGGKLLAGAGNSAQGQRPLGIEEVAIGPAGLDPRALTGAVTELTGDGMRRRGLEPDVEVNGLPAVNRHDPDLDR